MSIFSRIACDVFLWAVRRSVGGRMGGAMHAEWTTGCGTGCGCRCGWVDGVRWPWRQCLTGTVTRTVTRRTKSVTRGRNARHRIGRSVTRTDVVAGSGGRALPRWRRGGETDEVRRCAAGRVRRDGCRRSRDGSRDGCSVKCTPRSVSASLGPVSDCRRGVASGNAMAHELTARRSAGGRARRRSSGATGREDRVTVPRAPA
jgi:hypothetical protein